MKKQSYIYISQSTEELMGQYITGFVEGEGCFSISIFKDKRYKMKYQVYSSFTIQLHISDLPLLKKIQKTLQCGKIFYNKRDNTVNYKVYKRSHLLNKIIPFFEKYPFHGNKKKSFDIFKQIMELISSGKHTTNEGINQLFYLKEHLNKRGNDVP